MILNGECCHDLKQSGGVYTSSSLESYGPDRWRYAGAGSGQFLFRRQEALAPQGFRFANQVYVSIASAGMVHNDNYHLELPVEGIDTRALMWGTPLAKDLTVQFQFAAGYASTATPSGSLNGNYSFTVLQGDTNQASPHYVTTIPYSGSGAFQQFALTIPGCTIGAWNLNLSTYGLKFIFDLGTGSDYETSNVNVWETGPKWRVANSIRLIEHLGAVITIGAVQDDIGDVAQPFRFVNYDDQVRYIQTANSRAGS